MQGMWNHKGTIKEHMNMDNYEKFRRMIDTHPSGAPPSEAFNQILRILFTQEEIDVAVHMGFAHKSTEEIARSSGLSLDDTKKRLEAMADKVIINSRLKDGVPLYSLLPTVPGLFELPFMKGGGTPMHDRLGSLWVEYNNGVMASSLCGDPTPQMRVVPVQESVEPSNRIHTCYEIEHLIAESEYIAVAHCACKVSGNRCDSPKEVCLIFGSLARAVVARGYARLITVNEALEVLKRSEEAGLVHMSNNSADKPLIVCNCCRCCCHFFAGLKKFNNPNALSPSPFEARILKDDCTACGLCAEKRCPVGAISLAEDTAAVQTHKCIGCGLCVSACPSSAIELIPRKTIPGVPATLQEMMLKMLKEKGKLESFMKLIT
jgi:Na+-translocating ferredoxin:NAD+ oxidoreductase subunit B